jgi:hypothetical protein
VRKTRCSVIAWARRISAAGEPVGMTWAVAGEVRRRAKTAWDNWTARRMV